jgi:ABC-type branched-subunit amino acid transport system ATPase component
MKLNNSISSAQVILLVGPKGAGKTTIGKFLEFDKEHLQKYKPGIIV